MLPWGKSDAAMGKVRASSRGVAYVSLQMQRAFLGVLATLFEVWGELSSQKNSFLFRHENKYTQVVLCGPSYFLFLGTSLRRLFVCSATVLG